MLTDSPLEARDPLGDPTGGKVGLSAVAGAGQRKGMTVDDLLSGLAAWRKEKGPADGTRVDVGGVPHVAAGGTLWRLRGSAVRPPKDASRFDVGSDIPGGGAA